MMADLEAYRNSFGSINMKIKTTDYCKIYVIKNTINDDLYYGQTWQSIEDRFYHHIHTKTPACPKLFNAMNFYGRENFYIEAVVTTLCQECADWLEDLFI